MFIKLCLKPLLLVVLCNHVNSELLDYIKNVGTYFGYGKESSNQIDDDILAYNVPYEVAIADEKFISEAAKLTGVVLSDLDSCQHRVILKLKHDCHKLNDEQLAKLAVMLLNCQSSVEGRTIYPCTDSMTIKDCTSSMDPDTWNSYHLMSNRARAVCYSIRQIQFRGQTEYTVNRLMDAARNQLFTLEKVAHDQANFHQMARNSFEYVTESQNEMVQQQRDLQRAQLHGQLALEDNIRRISEEKRLILETHEQLTDMTRSVQSKLGDAILQLETNADESRLNHKELLSDIIAIQQKAEDIFQRIEESSTLLVKQSNLIHQQYEATLAQLVEVNSTVHYLVTLVGGTRKALEEQMRWLSEALGGTDLVVEKLYAILWHILFILLSMLACAFLSAKISTRLLVTAFPTLNLVLTLQQNVYALNFIELCTTIATLILCQTVFFSLLLLKNSVIPKQIKAKLSPKKLSSSEDYNSNYKASPKVISSRSNGYVDKSESENEEDKFEFDAPTSPYLHCRLQSSRSRSSTPVILNGSVKSPCGAKTRMGTPCKLTSMPGRDFCYRHQGGDSLFAG